MTMQAEFADYLTRMLGRPVSADELATLSSGQQARAAGWLRERGCNPPDLRARLRARFSPAQILETGAAAASIISRANGAHTDGPRAEAPIGPSGTNLARLHLGVDIQRTDEIAPTDLGPDLKSSAELRAIFTLREISYAQSRSSPNETLCGLFCAKEALRKCDGALLALPLTAIEVLPDSDGKPAYSGYTLSISHSGGLAIAVALADLAIQATPPTVSQTPARDSDAKPSGVRRASGGAILVRVLALAGILAAFVIAFECLGLLRGVG